MSSYSVQMKIHEMCLTYFTYLFQVLDHLVIQKLNAEGRLEKKETKKGGSMFDKVVFCLSCLVFVG